MIGRAPLPEYCIVADFAAGGAGYGDPLQRGRAARCQGRRRGHCLAPAGRDHIRRRDGRGFPAPRRASDRRPAAQDSRRTRGGCALCRQDLLTSRRPWRRPVADRPQIPREPRGGQRLRCPRYPLHRLRPPVLQCRRELQAVQRSLGAGPRGAGGAEDALERPLHRGVPQLPIAPAAATCSRPTYSALPSRTRTSPTGTSGSRLNNAPARAASRLPAIHLRPSILSEGPA